MSTISVLIITYNEEENIRDCLESINWVDEIIIIDSYSKDQTIEIASKYTSQIYQRKFDDFASQRNYGLEKVTTEWILVLDADERVTPELKIEIKKILIAPYAEAYEIPFRNHFLGIWIKYCGWYPDYHLRLFINGRGKFIHKVHEKLEISGAICKLKGAINHFTYRNISQFIRKTDYYTTLAAEEMRLKNKSFIISDLIIRPIWRFFKMFILKRGYKDGIPGFILSMLYLFYAFIKYTKLWSNESDTGGESIDVIKN